jgi:hypothetical protein
VPSSSGHAAIANGMALSLTRLEVNLLDEQNYPQRRLLCLKERARRVVLISDRTRGATYWWEA